MASFRTLLATAALLLAPSAASADTICVGAAQPAGVSCTATEPFTEAGMVAAAEAAALSSANDVIRVAAGSLTLTTAITVDGAGDDDLIGAGREQTLLTSTIATGTAIAIGSGPSPGRIADLTLTTTNATGLNMVALRDGSTLERVALNERSGNNSSTVIAVDAGSDATIVELIASMDSDADDGVVINSGPVTVRDSRLSGPGYGGIRMSLDSADVASQISRITVSGFSLAISADSGNIRLSDSVIDLQEVDGAVGVYIRNDNDSDRTNRFDGTGVTIVGNGSNQTGASAGANSASETVTFRLADSLIALSTPSSTDVGCVLENGGLTDFTLARVAYRTGNTNTGNCSPSESDTVPLSPGLVKFRDAGAADYRPTYDSVVVDAGTTANPTFPTDRGGQARKVDGNGDGSAQLDLGAYEYQRAAPSQPSLAASGASSAPGQTVTFGASGSIDPESEAFSYTWNFGDGATATGPTASHAFAAAGTYTVRVTATDVTGATSAPATATITVVAPLITPGLTVRKAPTATIKRSAKGFALATNASKTTATLALTQASSLKISLAQLTPGRTKAGRCSKTAKTGKRCTIAKSIAGIATLSVSGATANLSFGGTWNGKRLKAGAYRVTLTPLTGSGASGSPVSYSVTLK